MWRGRVNSFPPLSLADSQALKTSAWVSKKPAEAEVEAEAEIVEEPPPPPEPEAAVPDETVLKPLLEAADAATADVAAAAASSEQIRKMCSFLLDALAELPLSPSCRAESGGVVVEMDAQKAVELLGWKGRVPAVPAVLRRVHEIGIDEALEAVALGERLVHAAAANAAAPLETEGSLEVARGLVVRCRASVGLYQKPHAGVGDGEREVVEETRRGQASKMSLRPATGALRLSDGKRKHGRGRSSTQAWSHAFLPSPAHRRTSPSAAAHAAASTSSERRASFILPFVATNAGGIECTNCAAPLHT